MQHGQFCRVAYFAARWRSVFVFLRSRPRASGRRGWVALVSANFVVSVRPRWNELSLHVYGGMFSAFAYVRLTV